MQNREKINNNETNVSFAGGERGELNPENFESLEKSRDVS